MTGSKLVRTLRRGANSKLSELPEKLVTVIPRYMMSPINPTTLIISPITILLIMAKGMFGINNP